MAGSGLKALEYSVNLLIRNGYLSNEIHSIEEHAATVASAIEEMAASAGEVASLPSRPPNGRRKAAPNPRRAPAGLSHCVVTWASWSRPYAPWPTA